MLLALIAACTAITWALRTMVVPLVALALTLAGWRPAVAAAPEPVAQAVEPVITQPLTAEPAAASPGGAVLPSLTVAQLRQRARTLGLPSRQWKSARKAELLELLAVS